MTNIDLIDTSVFIFFVNIPQEVKNVARKAEAATGLQMRQQSGVQLILPIATIVETLQHIWRIEDGGQRRKCAETFVRLLIDALDRRAPWTFIQRQWDEDFLKGVLAQGGVVPDIATSLGTRAHEAGDLLILAELRSLRASYPANLYTVGIWAFDEKLSAAAAGV